MCITYISYEHNTIYRNIHINMNKDVYLSMKVIYEINGRYVTVKIEGNNSDEYIGVFTQNICFLGNRVSSTGFQTLAVPQNVYKLRGL